VASNAFPRSEIAFEGRVVTLVGVTTYGDLKNKVVLLTGGANGIGAATVREFHEQGARVYFCDRDRTAGEKLEHELSTAKFTALDLTREREILRWIGAVEKAEKKVHVLVNNAAIDSRIPLEEQTIDKVDQLFAINLRPFFITVRACAPLMPPGQSAIINLSSITFHLGMDQLSAYVATKAAIIGLTRSLARELGPRGIRVNTVTPGWIMTERQLREFVTPAIKKLILKSQCVPELLQPVDIAQVILFLASDASRALTGQELLSDRGWTHS
jgi:NAD(P)-dependent dehydrogenase (short-subunit alcohol dehydrogenase family)